MLAQLPILFSGSDLRCLPKGWWPWEQDWFSFVKCPAGEIRSHLTRVPRACACLSRKATGQTSWVGQGSQTLAFFFADSSCDGTQSE